VVVVVGWDAAGVNGLEVGKKCLFFAFVYALCLRLRMSRPVPYPKFDSAIVSSLVFIGPKNEEEESPTVGTQ